MKVIVWHVGEWKPSRNGDGKNKVVVFKPIDPEESGQKKEYKLNMTDYEMNNRTGVSIRDTWEEACKVGNVLDVVIFSNGMNVNKYEAFRVIEVKPTNQSEESDGSQ